MANVLIDSNSMTAIANAIRSKNGTATKYKPNQMAAAIMGLSASGSSGSGESKTYYLVDLPTLINQSFTVSLDGVAQTAGQSFMAEKGSVITYTNPVGSGNYNPGEITVTGGSQLAAENSYCVTSNITITIGAATIGQTDPGTSNFNITKLASGEILYINDVIEDVIPAGTSDWNTNVYSEAINERFAVGSKVKFEYGVFIPTGCACAYGPEFIIYTETSKNARFSPTQNNMHEVQYQDGKYYYAIVEYTVNDHISNFPFYKQYGAQSGSGTIKIRVRSTNLTQNKTTDIVSSVLYPWT